MAIDYLKKILTAKVYDVAVETELKFAPNLSARTGNRVYLKREDDQPVFSFKLRGAYNKMASLTSAERKRGVITASAGNHAQGVAFSAARMECKAVICMPVTTPQLKIDGVRSRGGEWVEVVLHGESYSDAYNHAAKAKNARNWRKNEATNTGTVCTMTLLTTNKLPINSIATVICTYAVFVEDINAPAPLPRKFHRLYPHAGESPTPRPPVPNSSPAIRAHAANGHHKQNHKSAKTRFPI